jgi:hypothetical protein
MRGRTLAVVIGASAAVTAARVWAQAEAPDPGAGSAGSGSGSGSDTSKGDAATANLQAQESLPQVTAARGGSFGIPSTLQTSGLHASLDAQLFSDTSKENIDAFAQLAGLPISANVGVDVVAQTITQDMQRFVLDGTSVKPEMYAAQLSSAGLRIRLRGTGVLVVSKLQTKECLDLLDETIHDQVSGEDVAIVRLLGDKGFGGYVVDCSIAAGSGSGSGCGSGDTGDSDHEKLSTLVAKAQGSAATINAVRAAQQALDKARSELQSAQLQQNAADMLSVQEATQGSASPSALKANLALTVKDKNDAVIKARHDLAAAKSQLPPVQLEDRDGIWHTFDADVVTAKARQLRTSCKLDEIKGVSAWTGMFGAHVLRRSSDATDGVSSNGAALEATLQHDGLNSTGFLGLSFEYLNHALDKDTLSRFDFVPFHALRLSAGYEYRASHSSDGSDLLPRIGVYGVGSVGWWHDNYTFNSVGGSVVQHVGSVELEGGVYASGKFTNNFTGMVVLRMLKPFGDFNQGPTFLISLIPAVSAGK